MITVTGATGQLGRLVVNGLLDAGVPAADLRAVVRTPAKAADLAERGVDVRQADYTDESALREAFAGTDRLFFVSGSEIGQREAQHRNVVTAAAAAGVSLVVYTSAPKADTSTLPVGPEHKVTEEALRDSGLDVVVLRNNWYLENYDAAIGQAAATGNVPGSAGEGRVWAATRADYAAAGVAVLTADRPELGVLELGGDEPFTMAQLAAEVGRQSGREVTYTDLPAEEHAAVLAGAGLPEPVIQMLVGIDAGVRAGELDVDGGALSRLTGRPTTSLAAYVSEVLAR
jgi:NAD(P)H dehydrogenase (quinone)